MARELKKGERTILRIFIYILSIAVIYFSMALAFSSVDDIFGETKYVLEPRTLRYTLCRSYMLIPFFLCFVFYHTGRKLIDPPERKPFDRPRCMASIAVSTALITWLALSLIGEITSPKSSFEAWTFIVWLGVYILSTFAYFANPQKERHRQRHLKILRRALVFSFILFLLCAAMPNY